MKILYSHLEKYFSDKLPKPEELSELFSMHAFEVDGMELISGDTVMDVKVLPDRAHYALCHRGVAREVSSILKFKRDKTYKDYLKDYLGSDVTEYSIDESLETPKIVIEGEVPCLRSISRRINNVSIEESTPEVKNFLNKMGQKPINSIVDATNFITFDIGQPLHAFDADKIVGDIKIRMAEEGEKITLLGGKEVFLNSKDIVIADDEGPLDIAGIKGSKRAEVTMETKNIILESGNFNATTIRKTSTRLGVRSEASKRYENEITPELAEEAVNYLTDYIYTISPKAKIGKIVDLYPVKSVSWTVKTSVEEINDILGSKIDEQDIVDILVGMDMKVAKENKSLLITPPLDRYDVKISKDIADEVGRIYGYEKITTKLTPKLEVQTPIVKNYYYSEYIKNILVNLGYSETLLYSLVPKGYFEVTYPLASDKSALREKIGPKIEESLILNSRNADFLMTDQIKIFEIGKIFPKEGERLSLCVGVNLVKKKKGVTAEKILGEDIVKLSNSFENDFEVKFPEYKIHNSDSGAIVEIDITDFVKKLPEKHNLKDLNFVPLDKGINYVPYSPYPFASRDVAVFVPAKVESIDVEKVIRENAGNQLVRLWLFDVFTKEDADTKEKKTSFAWRLVFQSFERTLTEDEINNAMKSVTDALGKNKGWVVR